MRHFHSPKEYKKTEKLEHAYDLVFHGGISDAKGLDYVLRLAPFLSKYSILIPDSRSKIESYWNGGELAENLVFKACTWESGLKEEVINARMVLCPSIWSAPIEGALIKSIIFNGYVAVFSTQFGFSKELKSEQFVFVDWDLPSSAAKLIDALVRRENTEKKIIIKDIFESTELDMREF